MIISEVVIPRRSTNDEAEMQEQPRADDVDEEEREMTHRPGKKWKYNPRNVYCRGHGSGYLLN